MTSTTDLPLASDFPQATHDDWRKLVDGVLKGAPFEKLTAKTYDGVRIEPIYRRATNATLLPGRAAAAPWQIMQRIDHPDAAKANAIALDELGNGATGLEVEFAGGPGARGFGVIDATPDTLQKLFDGVMFDAGISIALNPVVGRDNAGDGMGCLQRVRGLGNFPYSVIPAKAGIHLSDPAAAEAWTPAFAGVTNSGKAPPLIRQPRRQKRGLHLLRIAFGRHAEHAGIFPAELRRALIANFERRRFDVDGA